MNKHMLKTLISNKLVSLRIREEITIQGDTELSCDLDNWIDQLDEPQKVVVPEFVAEWIESHKKSFSDASAIDMYDNLTSDNRSGYYHEVWLWVIAHHHDFIKAWHDGYDVEREKLYTVEIPNPNEEEFLTVLAKAFDGKVFIDRTANVNWRYHKQFQLTESEIRQDFDWAWQAGFAKEVADDSEV